MKLDTKRKPRTLKHAVSDNQIDDVWMTFCEVCSYLKATKSQIRAMVHRRGIPYSKLGHLLRFHRPTIDEWMLSNSK